MFFWLIVVGAVMLVGVVGCCGGLFLLLPGTKWQDHESKDGGFKVELPGKPQPDVAKATGLRLENGTQAEGTVLLRRAEKFLVIYRDIKPTNKRDTTDEQELDARIEKLRKGLEAERLIRNDPITVNGFPGREVEFRAKTGWHTARVIVADTRVYIVIAGGGAAQPGDGDVRRFLDSFKITDPKLLDEGKRREEQAKLVAEAAQEAKEREAKRKAEEAAEQEASDLHDAAESVAAAALTTARRTRPAPPVAPPPHEPRPPAPLPIDD